MDEPYRVTIDTLVGEALFAVPGADQIFEENFLPSGNQESS